MIIHAAHQPDVLCLCVGPHIVSQPEVTSNGNVTPMQGGRATIAAQGFAAKSGDSVDTKADDVDQATPKQLTPGQRVAT